MLREEFPKEDDVWIRTACEVCRNFCGILVHRVDGEIEKIEGDPDNPKNYGRICAKGVTGFFHRLSPTRVTQPLKRTNPKKGVNEDPKWQPISWDEALNLIAQKLNEIRAKDPRLLYVATFDMWSRADIIEPWVLAYGTEARAFSAGFYCGNNVHNIHLATEGAHEADPDTKYVKYLLLFGSQYGAVINQETIRAAHEIASKRPGGIKVVSIDPVGSYAAARAEEWLPIRPGTDAALALCFINLLLNEYYIYDEKFLKERTNAPYLVGVNELYLRDAETGKPLVWDSVEGKAKTWDQLVRDYALEGTFTVNGVQCQPAFQKLKDHVRKYDPEKVSVITTIPADTIRRIAKEFGEAANVGGTININGKELPYRPASVAYYRGLSAHKHSMLSGLAVETLQVIIGGIDVPGGLLGSRVAPVRPSTEGMLTVFSDSILEGGHYWSCYPPRKVMRPESVDLLELFPVAVYSRPFFIKSVLEPEVMKPPYLPEMMIQVRTNFVKTGVFEVSKFLEKLPFMVSISLELDETADLSDIVLPDVHYLERLSVGASGWNNSGSEPWFFNGQKPVAKAPLRVPWGEMLNVGQIFLELAKRAGFLGEVHDAINKTWALKDEYKLNPREHYAYEDMVDRRLKSKLGEEYGLDWFMRDGLLVRDKPIEKMYRGAFPGPRVHIYFEFMKRAGEELERVTKQMGVKWDVSDYQVLPDWKPCAVQTRRNAKFDLILTNFKVPHQSSSLSNSNRFMVKLANIHRSYDVWLNTESAMKRGIKDGDSICIETVYGKKVGATARVTELVHPEVVACQADGRRFARTASAGREGINFNELVSIDDENLDYVSSAIDSHIPVAIYKAQTQSPF
ncbi:MAG: molybdopterin-dependent oxidoreductase [Nitrososphaerales archaeon]